MTAAGDFVDVTRYTQEYERVRSQVSAASSARPFGPAPPPVGVIGLALLLREGLPAWLRAVRQVLNEAAASAGGEAGPGLSPSPRASPAIPRPAAGVDGSGGSTSSSPLVEPASQRDLTTLLASLVLSARSARHSTDAASMKEPSPCH